MAGGCENTSWRVSHRRATRHPTHPATRAQPRSRRRPTIDSSDPTYRRCCDVRPCWPYSASNDLVAVDDGKSAASKSRARTQASGTRHRFRRIVTGRICARDASRSTERPSGEQPSAVGRAGPGEWRPAREDKGRRAPLTLRARRSADVASLARRPSRRRWWHVARACPRRLRPARARTSRG